MTKFFDVYVACPAIGRSFTEYNGVRIFEVDGYSTFHEFVRELNPDVLFCNMIYSRLNTQNLNFYADLDCYKVMNPVGGPFGLKEKWLRFVLRQVGEIFDAFIEVDCESSDYFRDTKFVPPDKMRVIPQGIDPEEFGDLPDKDTLRQRYGIKEDNYFFSGQGFWRWKNQTELVSIFRDFQANDVALVVSGHSTFTDGSLAQVREAANGDSRVHILPDMARRDFLAFIKHSIAHCSRSKIEGPQPNVMLECGFLETPYLTTSASSRWREEHYPHILVADEPREFLQWLDRLSKDAGIRQGLGQAGHESLLKIGATWPEVLAAYERLFLGGLAEFRHRDARPRKETGVTLALSNWLKSKGQNGEIRRLIQAEIARNALVASSMEEKFGTSFREVKRGRRLLDVYCGPASYLARLGTIGLKEGVDPSRYPKWVYENYRRNRFHVHVIGLEELIVCGKYDVVLFFNSPRGLADLEGDISSCHKLLADNGVLHLARFMDAESISTKQTSQQVLDNAASRCGFKITSYMEHVPSDSLGLDVGKQVWIYLARLTKAAPFNS
jgi:glycosyltransferase involved in cell wall biosynthesis